MPARPDAAPALSAVDRLLCACAFPEDHPAPALRLRALDVDSIDWDAVPLLLVRHGLTVLAASHLAAIGDRVPAAVWEHIQALALAARASALALVAELLRILRRLSDAGIDTLPFKGPLLGLDAYGDLAARPFVDLDLLVRPGDLDAAIAALSTLGYRSRYRFSPARDRWFRRVDGDYPLVHPDTAVLVELHGRAMSRRFGSGIPTDDLWRRHAAQYVGSVEVPVLSDNDRFYLYVVHGAKHRWERLEWLASTAALLRRRDGDVTALLHAPYHDARAVLLGCRLAHDLLDAPLHPAIAAAIDADPVVGRLAADARRHLFAAPRDDDREDTAAKLWFNFRLATGVGRRLAYLYRWCVWPSPEDWEAVSIPDPLFLLYRIARPIRLLWRYAGGTGEAPHRG